MLRHLSKSFRTPLGLQQGLSKRFYTGPTVDSSHEYIDLRSDTVTRPSKKMRDAMASSVVGDDVYQDDPTVNHLQKEVAKLFGKEQALFVPSGTMGNLISMMVNVRHKGDAAIIGNMSHVFGIERGGISALGSIHPLALQNQPDGTMKLQDIEDIIPPVNEHLPQPKVIVLENTHNMCNGRVLPMNYVKAVKKIAKKSKLRMHLDGARCLNAAVYLDINPQVMVKDFDTISFCFSKGMGCPVGSVVMGTEADIQLARIARKMLGGTMRQTGVLASCALVSLEDWKEKLQIDHKNAKILAQQLTDVSPIEIDLENIQTNIFRFKLPKDYKKFTHISLSQTLREQHKILMNASFKGDAIRIVTHRDFSEKQMEQVIKTFKAII